MNKKNSEKENKSLIHVKQTLQEAEYFSHAAKVLSFDRMTACPEAGRKAAGESAVIMELAAYKIEHDPVFMEEVVSLNKQADSLGEKDRRLVELLYREYLHTCHISEDERKESELIKSRAWDDWHNARVADNYKLFEESLSKVRDSFKKEVMSWETAGRPEAHLSAYERMLESFEPGNSIELLDALFSRTKVAINDLLRRISNSKKQIRTDFLYQTVSDEAQRELAEYLLDVLKFDRNRGSFAESEHPFTDMLAKDDIRLTTRYESGFFLSSMYSILHECGHALFEQLQPEEDHEYFISRAKTMGMHESVSRFYENVIGRSKEFIHLIYPKLCEIFPKVLYDVTEQELYEAVNVVTPSLIRVDADELTYVLHIIIRYELEKVFIDGGLPASELPEQWRRKYKEYLGVDQRSDKDGVLQDVHWASDFGYFPSYAIGNFYNCMYFNKMSEDFDTSAAIENGDFDRINGWMRDHVFAKADMLSPAEWIKDITGRSVTADDFIAYLTHKYTTLYELKDTTTDTDRVYSEYARRMMRIRKMSTLQLEDISTADAYRMALVDNFRNIGEEAKENRRFINDIIDPIVNSDEVLTEDTVAELQELNRNLMDVMVHENTDLPVMAMVSGRLIKDARGKNDTDYLIRQLDEEIIACVSLVVETRRIVTNPGISGSVRKRGLEALRQILEYTDKDKFMALSEESRELVMINSRFGDGLFVTMTHLDEEERKYRKELLLRSIEYAKDPFYVSALPNYDWNYHVYRIYQYLSSYDEFSNAAGNTKEELDVVADFGEKLEEMWKSDKSYEELDDYAYIHSHTMRNRMHAGRITRREYADALYELYIGRDQSRYDVDAITGNIEIPSEYINALDPRRLTEEQKERIAQIYRSAVSYIFHMPKFGTFYELMDYYAPLIYRFLEVPGGVSFEEIGLSSFAALHPPTYIHSNMVARIARCLTTHLLEREPERFIGVCGVRDKSEVNPSAARILDFTYHAALCHDFGKLIIIDTVLIYGRKILDFEFDIIKEHPSLGARMLEKHESTKSYADVARGHHRWFDGSKGYPIDFDYENSPIKTIIDIVACADCMDAATDTIGRSYSTGKTLDQFIGEVKEGSGTRYAPYLYELLLDETVRADLDYLLKKGRSEVYRSTYELLRKTD